MTQLSKQPLALGSRLRVSTHVPGEPRHPAGQRSEPLSRGSAMPRLSPAGTARPCCQLPAGTRGCAMAGLLRPAVTAVLLCFAVSLEASPELSGESGGSGEQGDAENALLRWEGEVTAVWWGRDK